MTTGSKKRRSTNQVYETEPNVKQVQYRAPKRSIRDKHPPWSSSKQYQQTITQMNPFHAIFHPDSENIDLEYEQEEPESFVASPVSRKRRKVSPEKSVPRRIETRSSASKSTRQDTPRVKEDISPESIQKARPMGKSQASLMPPPQTPRHVRKREIPSSQSPADSPLSTQSRTPTHIYTRSPLKERSTNCMSSPLKSARKAPQWMRKLEVADSMETIDNESQGAVPLGKVDDNENITAETDIPQLPDRKPANKEITFKEIPDSSQGRSPRMRESDRSKPIAILDSDNEPEDEDETEWRESKTQPATSVDADIQGSSPLINPKPSMPFTSTQATATESNRFTNNHPDETIPENGTPTSSSFPPNPRFQPSPASAQLFHDLHRSTQPGGLQTESQYENAWMPYHPASPTPSPSPSPSLPSSTKPPLSSQNPPMTVPTQLLPLPNTNTISIKPTAIPPSQASTTDITQTQHLPSRDLPSSSSLALPSSPPPMPPPPSSSSPSRVAELWKGWEWNGVRLTDSQLLPESLLNDSVGMVGPPDMSEDELIEE